MGAAAAAAALIQRSCLPCRPAHRQLGPRTDSGLRGAACRCASPSRGPSWRCRCSAPPARAKLPSIGLTCARGCRSSQSSRACHRARGKGSSRGAPACRFEIDEACIVTSSRDLELDLQLYIQIAFCSTKLAETLDHAPGPEPGARGAAWTGIPSSVLWSPAGYSLAWRRCRASWTPSAPRLAGGSPALHGCVRRTVAALR